MSSTVILFGAGATKACGGPLTNEILPEAFQPAIRQEIEREYYIDILDRFLVEDFHVPPAAADRSEADYPACRYSSASSTPPSDGLTG